MKIFIQQMNDVASVVKMPECRVREEGSENPINSRQNGKALIFPQVRCALTASVGLFMCGTINGWSGSSLTKMDADFKNMAATEYSLVASMINYGALLGSLLSGKAMDILGRRKLMLTIAPLAACGWAIIGFAPDVYVVYIGRFVCGVSTGFLFASCSIYTSETCQAALRGRLGSLPTLNMTFGILITYIFGGFFSWRISAFLCILPTFIFFVNLYLIPESPYWYLLKGNNEAASESLTLLRGPNFNIENEMQEMTQKLSDVGTNISYWEILNRRTLLPLAVALFMQTLQQVSGGNVIMRYTSNLFEKAESSIDAQMATIYTGVAQLTGTSVSILVIDKYGRRILLTISVTLCGIFMGIFGAYFLTLSSKNPWPAWSPLIILLCLLFTYCLGCRSIPWLIGSEIFNTSVRSRANSITVFYNRVLNLIVIQVYPYTVKSFGESTVFISIGVLCLLCAVGTLVFVPETKGKTLEEIQEYFENRASKKNKRDPTNT